MIHSHSRAGYSYGQTGTDGISTSAVAVAITKDATNSAQSASFPNSCNIQSIEVYLTDIDAGSLSVTAYLTRDPDKLVPVTPGATSGATQDITYTSGTAKGGVVFAINSDYHYDSSVSAYAGVSDVAEGTIYCVISISSGTATGKIKVN